MSRIPADVVEQLLERAAGYCEIGGAPLWLGAHELHHRKRRGMGGDRALPDESAENLLVAHPGCHRWVHAERDLAYAHGFSIRENDDPAATPIRVLRGLCTPPC